LALLFKLIQMKYSLLTFLWLLCFYSNSQYSLVWADEFDGDSIDQSKWNFDIGQGVWGWGNNELQYYTQSISNIGIDTGYLRISAKNENFGPANYTSAKITTKDLYEFKYGRVEARIKVPMGQGLWPAFWMLGSNIDDVSWPQCGEIDIMEHVNNETVIHGTHHYNNNGHTYYGGSTPFSGSDFHVYRIDWTPSHIKWYLDGNLYFTANIGAGSISKEEFHEPFYMILNLAVGGNWPGSPDSSTPFPSLLLVDYVRVYQNNLSLDQSQLSSLNVFPNPSKTNITFEYNDHINEYNIYDVLGNKIVSGICVDNTLDIDVSNFSEGLYYFSFTTSDKLIRKPFIVN